MTQLVTKNLKLKTTLILVVLSVIGYWSFVIDIHAQTAPQIIITWQAYNYYPSDYPAKAFATTHGQIVVRVETTGDNNKILDISNAAITWYVDGKFVKSGIGLKEIPLTMTKLQGDNYIVRVLVQLTGNEIIEGLSIIPIKSPEVVIESPFPNNNIPGGQTITFQAIPYFFNVTSLNDLTFSWQLNGKNLNQNQDNRVTIDLEMPSVEIRDNTFELSLLVQSVTNPLELKRSKLILNAYRP